MSLSFFWHTIQRLNMCAPCDDRYPVDAPLISSNIRINITPVTTANASLVRFLCSIRFRGNGRTKIFDELPKEEIPRVKSGDLGAHLINAWSSYPTLWERLVHWGHSHFSLLHDSEAELHLVGKRKRVSPLQVAASSKAGVPQDTRVHLRSFLQIKISINLPSAYGTKDVQLWIICFVLSDLMSMNIALNCDNRLCFCTFCNTNCLLLFGSTI